MRRMVCAAIMVAALLLPSSAGAAGTLDVTAVCNGKWVSVAHGADLTNGAVFFSRDGRSWIGPVALESFVPDVGGGYAHVDYDVDIWVQQRDTSAKVLAEGKVHTPICGGEDIRPTAGWRTATTTTTTTTVPPTTTAPSSKLVIAGQPVTPQLSWLPAVPDWVLRAIVEAVRGLP